MLGVKLLLIALLIGLSASVYDVLSFGAIPHSDTVHDQFINAKAILNAIKAANQTQDG